MPIIVSAVLIPLPFAVLCGPMQYAVICGLSGGPLQSCAVLCGV